MKEEDLLIAAIEDKIQQSIDHYIVTHSNFLDIRQRTIVDRICRKYKGLRYCFYGGYEDAERSVVVFLPDYASQEDNNPLALLRITQDGYKELSHRDYLGSLTGLGIKREMIGDILVRKDGADVILIKDISDFLIYNYEKAGRVNIKVDLYPINEIIVTEGQFEEKKDTVASLRLDNIIAAAFSMSRGKAAEAIESGMVFINGLQCVKIDLLVKEGDKFVIRGKGKVVLKTVGGITRKDRIFIVIEKFL